jgi:signal transduction histidine kinase
VLTSKRTAETIDGKRLRLLSLLKNVSLLERPVHAVTLVSAVQAALRARRRQYEVQGYLLDRERATERLESLVAERTLQLEATNERLLAEIAERERTEATLRQAQKMEAIGQLTGGIAHDFNNLLTVITGNLDLLQRHLEAGGTDVKRFAAGAMAGATRAAGLTQRLLAFARRQPLSPSVADVNQLVVGLEDIIGRTVGEHIRVRTCLSDKLWRTWCDTSQLETALINLVVNARDAIPDGGGITIETSNAELDRVSADCDGAASGQYVCVAVSDTGTGMSPEVIARAFDPFFTTKPIGQGLTLTHISLGGGDRLSEFVAFNEDHEDEPALPDRLPAGFAVGLAGEKAAQAGDAAQEVAVGGEAVCWLLKLGGEDPDRRLRHVRRRAAVTPGGIAQPEETNGDDGQSAEQRDQPIGLLQLPLLGPAAGFPGLVELLDDPSPGVPGDDLERLVEALDRPGGQQQPFECVVPDAHARHSDRRAPRGTVARRQKLQLTPGHADDCFSLPGQDRGGAHRTGRP